MTSKKLNQGVLNAKAESMLDDREQLREWIKTVPDDYHAAIRSHLVTVLRIQARQRESE